MLEKWSLHRFKSVATRNSLEFAPLTVFTGPNSSGKSTVLQSILLTAQTLQSPVQSRAIVLNGHISRLGTFADVASHGAANGPIEIGFSLRSDSEREPRDPHIPSAPSRQLTLYWEQGEQTPQRITVAFSFSAGVGDAESDALQLQPRLETCRLHTESVDDELAVSELVIKRSDLSSQERAHQLKLVSSTSGGRIDPSLLNFEVVSAAAPVGSAVRGVPKGKAVGAALSHFLPTQLAIVYDATKVEAERFAQMALSPREGTFFSYWYGQREPFEEASLSDHPEFVHALNGIIETFRQEAALSEHERVRHNEAWSLFRQGPSFRHWRACLSALPPRHRRVLQQLVSERADELERLVRQDRPPEFRMARVPLAASMDAAVHYVQTFFTRKVRYLGPLRDEPKPVYPLAGGIDPSDIGFRGEHTAAVLDLHRNTTVTYLEPPHVVPGKFSPGEERFGSLQAAVLCWLKYMGVAEHMDTVDRGKLGHTLRVGTTLTDSLHDLTHVGVGVSQVLPILVLALLADQGSTLIFEQPELHLHPKVQTRLADFVLSMTVLGKQCIVETHSEYLVNRLRLLAALSDGDSVSGRVALYFAEFEGRQSKYRRVRMNQFGVLDEWPRGFFDEGERLAADILRAGLDKRRRPS